MIKFPFVQFNTINTAGPIVSHFQQYKINSLFDPYVGVGSGNQPLGYDQYITLYQRYFVYGCKVQVNFWKANNDLGHGWCHLIASQTSTVYTGGDVQSMHSRPNTFTKQITPWNGNGHPIVMRKYYRIKNWLREKEDPSDVQALTGGDPTSIVYLNVGCSTYDGTAISDITQIRVKLTYYAMLFQPPAQLLLS